MVQQNLLKENPKLTADMLSEKLTLSRGTVEYNILKLKKTGVLIRHGSARNGYWDVK